jgi:N-acetylmuramoyl-L-alanine amidase
VEKQFRQRLNMLDRGVKQAGFLVLYKTAMPGVLIETGFLSNSKDEKYLLSEKGQEQLANAIFRAFREYKYTLEKRDLSTIREPEINPETTAEPEQTVEQTETSIVAADNPPVEQLPSEGVKYRVQFLSSPVNKSLTSDEFSGIPNMKMYCQSGLYKYTAGNFETAREASSLRSELAGKGFKDAFVIPFFRDKRITPEEARRLTGK